MKKKFIAIIAVKKRYLHVGICAIIKVSKAIAASVQPFGLNGKTKRLNEK